MVYRLIQGTLRAVTFRLPAYRPGQSPIRLPEKFSVFSRYPDDPMILFGLANAYRAIFSEPPWNENWPIEKTLAKLQRELAGDCFLVVMRGEGSLVSGFSWGALVSLEHLESRIEPALGIRPVGLAEALRKQGTERLVYFDELAVLESGRGGPDPVRFLLRPGLELGHGLGVFKTMFWSTPKSKIVPLATYMGYRPIFEVEHGGKEIVFLLNSDFLPLLKVTQYLSPSKIVRVMRFVSLFLQGRRNKAGS